jgi:hypothetical protein
MRPDEYVWITRWGRLMGSGDHYIKDQQRRAAQDKAPVTATFRDHDTDAWNTVESITNEATLMRLAQMYRDDKEAVRILTETIAALHREEQPARNLADFDAHMRETELVRDAEKFRRRGFGK